MNTSIKIYESPSYNMEERRIIPYKKALYDKNTIQGLYNNQFYIMLTFPLPSCF